MPLITHQNIGISGMAAAIPKKRINNYRYTDYFPKNEVKRIVDKTGIYERRFADDSTCSSDLCYAAAEQLILKMNIKASEIDVLLFVSQTPDFRMPATACLLQNRLKLGSSTIAFDINLGCSGFIVALQTAYAMLANPSISKILLLNGETRSKVYSAKDRKTAFLFGDAGSATLIEKGGEFGESYFSLNTDGSGGSIIRVEAGGYRNPSSKETLVEKVVDEYGNIRNDEQGVMDGESVFSFVAKKVPKDIERLLVYSGVNKSDINYFVFHQASKMINDFLIRKLEFEPSKIPSSLHKFGNTSSVSIPLTIVSELKEELYQIDQICLCAFGVGLSWGSAIIKTSDMVITDLLEV